MTEKSNAQDHHNGFCGDSHFHKLCYGRVRNDLYATKFFPSLAVGLWDFRSASNSKLWTQGLLQQRGIMPMRAYIQWWHHTLHR